MARVKLNPIIDQVRGKIGDLVFRSYGGETILSRLPDLSGVVPTAGQEAQRFRFRDAAFYGRVVLEDLPARTFYEEVAARRKQPLFSVIVGDYLNPPTVDALDVAAYTGATGDPILISAHDDVEVVQVVVTLTDGGGAELETGPAVPDEGRWRYEAQTDVPSGTDVTITARATGRPGNAGEEAVEVTTPDDWYRRGW